MGRGGTTAKVPLLLQAFTVPFTNTLSVTCSFIFSPEEKDISVQVVSLVGRFVYFPFAC